jgi:predicted DNA-binding mobile mystery protein A
MIPAPAKRRSELDARLRRAAHLLPDARPERGWIRTIRDALGMSSSELAARLGVSQSWIPALERNEVDGSIKLETLERAADALGCELVYALVPRTSLAEAVEQQAQLMAWEQTGPALRRMRAAGNPIPRTVAARIDEAARRRVDRRGLWALREARPLPPVREWDIDEVARELSPPTADDVSITMDGRRLDTVEKMRAFVAELWAEREADNA